MFDGRKMPTLVMSTEKGQFARRSSPSLRYWIQLTRVVRVSKWLDVRDLVFAHVVWIAVDARGVKLTEVVVSRNNCESLEDTYDTVRPETCRCTSSEPVQTH